ncbi:uncharacterized protein LOC143242921 [Tachypleus tridentatus]|uniref:uncharacterized protein LOC143242921 n=1 Tax=Tachypleus tridentatus TaxID=6853 RepID=UPI003FD44CCD
MRHFLKFHLKFRVLLVLSMGVFPANGISTNSTTASTTGFSSTPSRPTDSIIKSTAGFSSTPGNISGSTTDSSTDSSTPSSPTDSTSKSTAGVSSTPSSPTDSIIKSTAGFSSTPGKISGSITDSSTDSSTPSSPAGFSTDYFTGYLTKSTLFSPSTTEKRTTTTELFDPCSPNPCLNGGTCDAISTNEYSCTCRYGFVDVNCKELDYCNFTLNGTRGDDYCNNNNAICISDNKTESFICSCVEDLDYFDYNENSCKGIPECLYNDICKQHEICNTTTGECRCKEDYQHNDTNSCVAKDFCAENCKGLNTVCTRGPEDNPKNIDCKCVTNYAKTKRRLRSNIL